MDRLFWLGLRRWWSKWATVLVVVKPETVVGWHRAGFRSYWRFLSRRRPGRPKIIPGLRNLIRCLAAENPTWGGPRLHGELLQLGFEISESTVSHYLAQGVSPPDSGQRWLTFLKNHREAIAAMDFFAVPTTTFRVLYCFFVIAHDRRLAPASTHPRRAISNNLAGISGFPSARSLIQRSIRCSIMKCIGSQNMALSGTSLNLCFQRDIRLMRRDRRLSGVLHVLLLMAEHSGRDF